MDNQYPNQNPNQTPNQNNTGNTSPYMNQIPNQQPQQNQVPPYPQMPNQQYQNMYNGNMYQMKPCKHCKQMIDKKATVCPYCRKSQGAGCLSVLVVVVGVLLAFALISIAIGSGGKSSSSKSKNNSANSSANVSQEETPVSNENYKTSAESVAYEDIARNPDAYKGKVITATGSVLQAADGVLDSVTLRLKDDNGDTWYVTYKYSDDESRILEDDRITVYGECDGVESYTSVLGAKVTIPSIKAQVVEIADLGEMAYEITDTVFTPYQNSLGNTRYHGIVEITNTGTSNIYLKDCTFDFEDNDGHLLESRSYISSCPDIIAPGEKGYFYEHSGMIDSAVSLDNGINLKPNFTVELAKGVITDYEVSDTNMAQNDRGYVKVTGRITNNTEKDESYLKVDVIFRDASGKALAIYGTSVSDISAGDTASFDISASFSSDDTISFDQIASYDIVARKRFYQ